jgi:hypothetical protein
VFCPSISKFLGPIIVAPNFPLIGIPHSIQGLGDDGCEFLLVFDDGNLSPEKDKTHNVKRKRKEKREEKNGKLLNSQQQNKKKKIDRLRDSKGQFIKDKETEAHDHRIRTGKQKTSQADREQALLTITTNYKLKTSAADIECPVIGCEGKYTEFINVSQHIGRAHKELKKKIMESFSSFSEFLEFYQKNNI